MAGTRTIHRTIIEEQFDSASIRGITYIQSRKDPSCVLIIDKYNPKTDIYEVIECQEGEYGIGIVGRGYRQ